MRFILIIALLSILSLASYAQDKLFVAPFTIFNNDTFFIAEVPEVQVLAFKDKKDLLKISESQILNYIKKVHLV